MRRFLLVLTVALIDFLQLAKKHVVIFVLCFGGLIVSFSALFVFYMQSYSLITINNNIYSLNNSIEIYPPYSVKGDTSYSFMERLMGLTADLPAIKSITAASYQDEKFDVVGIYGEFLNMIPQEGRIFEKSDSGVIVVSLDALRAAGSVKTVNTGEEFTVIGGKYDILGVLEGRGKYPEFYDIRRMSSEQFAIAGVDNRHDNEKHGTEASVYLTMDDFMKNGMLFPDSVRITFKSPLNISHKEELERLIYERLLLSQDYLGQSMTEYERSQMIDDAYRWEKSTYFAEFTTAEEALFTDFLSRLGVYSAVIFISMVNVMAVFIFMLNKKAGADAVYRMCGASSGFTVVSGIVFIMLFLFFSAVVGAAVCDAVVFISDAFTDKRILSVGEYWSVFGIASLICLAVLLKPVLRGAGETYTEAKRRWSR